MSTKMLIAAVAGTVVAFFLGWVVFGILMEPYYQANATDFKGLYRSHEEQKIYGFALSNLCWSLLLAYIFDKWANIRSLGAGFMGGLIVFGLANAGFNLESWAVMNLAPYKMYIVNTLVYAVYGGIIGAVIGWVLGRSKSA